MSGVAPGQSALVMYDGGELIWVNTLTGKFDGKADMVFFSGPNCTGTPYKRGLAEYGSPDVLNRIYVGKSDYGSYIAFYKAVGTATGVISTVSQRTFNQTPGMGICSEGGQAFNTSLSGVGPMVVLQQIPIDSLKDLSSVAPLKVEFE